MKARSAVSTLADSLAVLMPIVSGFGRPLWRGPMYATSIRFAVQANTDWEELRQVLVRGAFEKFRQLPGLRSKAYVFSPERGEIGGNYVWETQDDAEAYLRSDLFRTITARFGQPRLLERAEIWAYIEDGDLVFPHDYEVQQAMGPDAAVPPLGL